MKKILLLLVCFATLLQTQAQDKSVQVNLGKNETISDTYHLGDNGFILKTSLSDKASTDDYKYKYYDIDCNLLWEKSVKNRYKANASKNYFVVSSDGAVAYYVEMKDNVYNANTQYVTQILKSGESKTFEVKGNDEFGKNLQAIFCDNHNLYYLTTDNGWEKNNRKKAKETLILNRFSGADMAYKKNVLDLPSITGGEDQTFWSYLGQKDEDKYLVSKTLFLEQNKMKFDIVVINGDGAITKDINLELALAEKFLRPALTMLIDAPKNEVVTNLDYTIDYISVDSRSTAQPRKIVHAGGFSNLYLDAQNNTFYAYGLSGPKTYDRLGPVYDSFYVYAYDLSGVNKMKLEQVGSKEMLNDKIFKIHSKPGDRGVLFRATKDQVNVAAQSFF